MHVNLRAKLTLHLRAVRTRVKRSRLDAVAVSRPVAWVTRQCKNRMKMDPSGVQINTLTLWRMSWEGTTRPALLDQHDHLAFGISVWLSQQKLSARAAKPKQNRRKMRLVFHAALERSLAT